MDTACELAKIDKVQVIEIVQNNKKNMMSKLLELIRKPMKVIFYR